MTPEALRNVLEAAMLAAGRALTVDDFLALFEGSAEAPGRDQLREALSLLEASLEGRALELVEVASGFRLQVRRDYSPWLAGLFAERPPRYSRALLETLALIAYRQPITRGEIEDVRGVAVGTNIIKTLMEREWIRVLGHREVPGRPTLYGTTRQFLDHFGLKSLEGLPTLAEVRDLDQVEPDLFSPRPADPALAASRPDGGHADTDASRPGADEPQPGDAQAPPAPDELQPGDAQAPPAPDESQPGDAQAPSAPDEPPSGRDGAQAPRTAADGEEPASAEPQAAAAGTAADVAGADEPAGEASGREPAPAGDDEERGTSSPAHDATDGGDTAQDTGAAWDADPERARNG